MNNTLVQFPYDSNIRYLPLVYFLPEDLLSQCPTLRRLPRDLAALAASEELMSLICPLSTATSFSKKSWTPPRPLRFPISALAAGRNIIPAIPRRGGCPTPCRCGSKAWSRKPAGAYKPCFVCRPIRPYRFSRRSMCQKSLRWWSNAPSRNRAGGPSWMLSVKCPATRTLNRGKPMSASTFSANGIIRVPRRCRRFR